MLLAILVCLLSFEAFAQTYHFKFSHDTVGNRVSRIYQGQVPAKGSENGNETQDNSITRDPADFADEDPADDIQAYATDAVEPTFKRGTLVKSTADKEAHLDSMMKAVMAQKPFPVYTNSRSLPSYSVGEIPLDYGVSGSGARTYSVPIFTAPDIKYAPALSLVYNSQGGYGYGGYGWDIGGLSSITLTNKSPYWDDAIQAASSSDNDGVFCLDGVRLVTNEDQATCDDYPLVTASGHILVAPNTGYQGYITSFTVLYPDGTRATYGKGVNLGFTLPSYPMVSSTDINGEKIEFCYTLDTADGNHAIDSVRYGIDNLGHASGVIRFVSDTSYAYSYFAGRKVRRTPMVTSITSVSSGVELYTYNLAYQNGGGAQLLKTISLANSSGEQLTPLAFTYGAEASPHQGLDSLKITATRSFAQVVPGGSGGFVFKRGKFFEGNYNDGLLAIRNLPLYFEVSDGVYACGYEPTGLYPTTFAYVACISDSPLTLAQPAPSGFQGAEAVDIDGDGVDEIVTVRCGATSAMTMTTQIYVDISRYDADGSPILSNTVSATFQGVIDNNQGFSPCRRAYHWGDFLGNGRAQLLVLCYTDNGFGVSQTPYVALFDPYAAVKMFDISSTNHLNLASGDDRKLFCLDINGDGRTEICHATADGLKVYSCSQTGYSLDGTFDIPLSVIDSDRTYYTDINSDGYIDIIQAPASGNSWTLYCNTGENFVQSTLSICSVSANDGYLFMDIDRDGYPDLMKVSGGSLGHYPNLDGMAFGAYESGKLYVSSLGSILPPNVVDYTSMSSFVTVDGSTVREFSYTSYARPNRHLVQSRDSYGKIVRNTFEYLPHACTAWTESPSGINTADGYQLRVLPMYVLSGAKGFMSDSSDAQVFLQDTYSWYDGIVHTQGLGFCGFSRTRTYSSLDLQYIVTVSRFNPQKRGIPVSVSKYPQTESHPAFSITTFTYDNHTTTYGKLQPRLTQVAVTKALDGVLSTTSYTYDSFDYPTRTVTVKSATGLTSATSSVMTEYTHSNDPSKYVLGVVDSQTSLSSRNTTTQSAMGTKTVFSYDTNYRPVTRNSYRAVSTSNARYATAGSCTLYHTSTDRWQYDTHGNVIREESAPSGSAVFVGKTYAYDASGRHLVSSTDELGLSTIYSGFDAYGNPAVVTNHKGQQTEYRRDGWGRLTRTLHPEGKVDSLARAWGGSGVYKETAKSSGSPDVIVEYDAAGREVLRSTKRFDAQWQKVATQYDEHGHTARVSLPYRGASPSYWNTYTHDMYGRLTQKREASGKKTMWMYSGTKVTEKKDGIKTVRWANVNGTPYTVADSLVTITYNYRDDGQPSSISSSGGATTAFNYDTLGRRTAIIDPSAGTRYTSYSTHADGSSTVIQTNANGSITTTYDSLGRETSIVRPDFNTTFTYDTCGRLMSKVSTNGTAERYTYDAYDRVLTAKDSVPNGKWLQKAYSYTPDGVMYAIAYTSQGGYITTETYGYSYGHNVSVKLPDDTYVYQLTAENQLGQPMAVTSGSVARTYSYTDYGMPTARFMNNGSLMEHRSFFDAKTGNLMSRIRRISANNYITETFTYDNLGRLTTAGNNAVAYDANSNITSMGGVGTMSYTASTHPYTVTGLDVSSTAAVGTINQSVSYTAYDRPSVMMQGSAEAYFTYDADGDRVMMYYFDTHGDEGVNYYIGDRYEVRQDPGASTSTQLLYLGGDAYSAPMVLRKAGSGSWTPYVIGRDYLGSITHIATTGGTLVEERSFDAWGRLRDPATNAVYDAQSQPSLFLGRGWCGHEHLEDFGLINMNARLYDPVLGRFLSPDPYVQSPDNPANFNRYAYCLNNPLKYTDESGEFFIIDSFLIGLIGGGLKRAANMAANDFRIWRGLFMTDENLSVGERLFALFSRFSLQAEQTVYGFLAAHAYNSWRIEGGVTSIEYLHGTTVITNNNSDWGAFTLGNYINGNSNLAANDRNTLFQHEYGHYLQSLELGPFYMAKVAVPSLLSDSIKGSNHNYHPVEQDANIRAFNYLCEYNGSVFNLYNHATGEYTGSWKHSINPIQGLDWKHFGTNSASNSLILLKDNLSYNWIDFFSVLPLNFIVPGINNAIYNNLNY